MLSYRAFILLTTASALHVPSSMLQGSTHKHGGGTSPEQFHISIAGDDFSSMRVAWYTAEPTITSQCLYDWGVSNQTASGSSRQYLKGHGYHHVALLGPLPYDKTIHYRCGDEKGGWSSPFSFRTAPSERAPFRMSIFGDMGYEDSTLRPMALHSEGLEKNWTATHSRRTLEALKNQHRIDAVWHLGDIGYVDDAFGHKGKVLRFGYEDTYNGYMNWMQNISATMPYMVSVGNHESECHSPNCIFNPWHGKPLSNFSAYNARWHMPAEESNARAGQNMWYSFDKGPAHFISLDTETDFPGAGESKTGDSHVPWFKAGSFGKAGEYMAWLEADLKKASDARKVGSGRAWIIAGGHRPYSEIVHCCGDLFDKYGVDLYFAGHAHSYSRSLPTSFGVVEHQHKEELYIRPNGTTWVVVGGAGCDEMQPPSSSGMLLAPDGSQIVTTRRYATGILGVTDKELHWQLIDSETQAVLDEFSITK